MRRKLAWLTVIGLGALGLHCTVGDDPLGRLASWTGPARLVSQAAELLPALSKPAPTAPAPTAAADSPGPAVSADGPRTERRTVSAAPSPSSVAADGLADDEREQRDLDPTAMDWAAGGGEEVRPGQEDEIVDAEEPEEIDGEPDETAAAGGAGPAPSADEAAPPTPSGPRPKLVSVARETWIYVSPSWSSRRLGYLRAGSVVEREAEPATHRKCSGGWYRLVPRGYVCVGSRASLDLDHPVARLSARRPDMTGLPFLYGRSRFPPPPLYVRLPTVEQQQKAEPKRDYHLRKNERLKQSEAFVAPPPPDPIPDLLRDGRLAPALGGRPRGPSMVSLGPARVKSAFAMLATFEHEGRRFGLTTEMALLPLDRLRLVEESSFHGVRLSDEFGLPVAFVQSRRAKRYRPHEPSGAFLGAGETSWREVLPLTGRAEHRGGHRYLESPDGTWLRADQVIRARRFKKAPRWAKQGRKWIDVSILRQTLVAYEGTTPVYATLVSTGIDGLEDPDSSHATVRGTFLIHTKHVSVTMDGDEQGDEFDFRDVPFVQYFTEGYALHGAYWHDAFGTPRSHGCINLAPRDAAWLFSWTTPDVPPGWHAALSLRKGTIVHIHP